MLTNSALVSVMAKKSGIDEEKCRQILNASLSAITDALAMDEVVTIARLGRWRAHHYPSRTIPDPRGGGHHRVLLPQRVVKFRPAISLRRLVGGDAALLEDMPPDDIEMLSSIAPILEVSDMPKPKKPESVQPDKKPTDPSGNDQTAGPNWLSLFSRRRQRELAQKKLAVSSRDAGPEVGGQAAATVAPPPPPAPAPTPTDPTDNLKLGSPVDISYQDLSETRVDKRILNLLPELFARRHLAVPIAATKKDITVAMVDPENLETIQLIKKSTGRNVKPVLSSSEDITRVLNQYSGLEAEVASAVKDTTTLGISEAELSEAEHENVESSSDDSPTARIITSLLRRAVREHASDVHIEPYEKAVVVRFRIDGVLRIRVKLPKEILPAVISRLKILASLKIDEHRLPQDGRFRLNIDAKSIDFRLSTLPVADGEKAVMRILDKSQGVLSLEEIGVRGQSYDILKTNIKRSYGMTLITGPTGSGKTTTLYALIGQLMDVGVNIVTLENPIEYRIEGINQSQVNPDIDYSFATGLRAIVRQDPDIIMVGEIRDKETASIAIQSALTGHIVLSTLHTNNASGAIPRLIDMGAEPFLISSSLNTVVAQRLARKLCEHCKKEEAPSSKELEVVKAELARLPKKEQLAPNKKLTFYTAKGCDVCSHTGYSGRLGLFEVLDVSGEVEQLILGSVTDTKIQDTAIAAGMVTMLQDGLLKAIDGITSLEEVWRITRD